VWIKALMLYLEIKAIPTRKIILSGHTHCQRTELRDDIYRIASPRIGVAKNTEPKTTQNRGAGVIVIDKKVKHISVEQRFSGHGDQWETAEWTHTPSEEMDMAEVKVLNEVMENEIVLMISTRGLYKLGRYETYANKTSLAWISLGPILNEKKDMIIQMSRITMEYLIDQQKVVMADSLLLGVGCWGAIIASHISLVTGMVNIAISVEDALSIPRAESIVMDSLELNLKGRKTIIMVTDVVATGTTINTIYKHVKNYCDLKGENVERWYLMSLIAGDKKQIICDPRVIETTFCAKVPIPVVERNELPSFDVIKNDSRRRFKQ